MKKLFSIIFIIMILMIGSMAFVHARPKYDPSYQCKHIGISKVKPFKKKYRILRSQKPLYANIRHARYESKQQF